MYDQDAVQPMRDELIAVRIKELLTPQDVDDALLVKDNKISLVMINSVCGCAAGSARPGVSLALQNDKIPDRLYTVFAGQEREAVDRVRYYIKGFPPSSPCVALFRNGELVYFMQRMDIEGNSANYIANQLKEIFNDACTNQGPSVPAEDFAKIMYAKQCGSKIPMFQLGK
jgi:putative YphP/YqiW family bacilliredoxin